MNILKQYSALVIPLFLAVMFSACKSDVNSITYKDTVYRKGDCIEITGMISRVGNEPFTSLIIIDESGERFSIAKESEETLLKLRESRVRISGILELKKLVTADGKNTSLVKVIIIKSAAAE